MFVSQNMNCPVFNNANMEDFGEDSLKNIVINFTSTCLYCNKTLLVRNHPLVFSGEKTQYRDEIVKSASVLKWKCNKV